MPAHNPFYASVKEAKEQKERHAEFIQRVKERTGIGVATEPVREPKQKDTFWSWAEDNFYPAY